MPAAHARYFMFDDVRLPPLFAAAAFAAFAFRDAACRDLFSSFAAAPMPRAAAALIFAAAYFAGYFAYAMPPSR